MLTYIYIISIIYIIRDSWLSIAPWRAVNWVFGQNLTCEWQALKDGHSERGRVIKGKTNNSSKAKALGHRGSPQPPAATCPADSVSVPYRHSRACTSWKMVCRGVKEASAIGSQQRETEMPPFSSSFKVHILTTYYEHRERCWVGRKKLESAVLPLSYESLQPSAEVKLQVKQHWTGVKGPHKWWRYGHHRNVSGAIHEAHH